MTKRIYPILTLAAIIVAIYQIFTLGYGGSAEIEYSTRQTIEKHTNHATEHLSVIYERKIGNKTDFIHLQVDTTYHAIGKGRYQHEVICNRKYSLRSFDDQYHGMNNAIAACFAESDEWDIKDVYSRIMDYKCRQATKLIDGEKYEAWYTTALPHQRPQSRAMDKNRGLILKAYNASGNYSLTARYIEQQIG